MYDILYGTVRNINITYSQGNELIGKEESRTKPSQIITQAKLTSLYGNKANAGSHNSSWKSKRSSNSDDCMIVEMADSHYNHPRGHNLSNHMKSEENERGHGNTLVSKRIHEEISSPRNDSLRSPSINEDGNTNGASGFVTARAKLVLIEFLKIKLGYHCL